MKWARYVKFRVIFVSWPVRYFRTQRQTAASPRVLRACASPVGYSQWERANFDPMHRIDTNSSPKICHRRLSRRPNLVQIYTLGFGANRTEFYGRFFNPHTNFEMYSFTHSKIQRYDNGPKFKNGSHDPDHVHLGVVCHRNSNELIWHICVYEIWRLYFRHFRDMKNPKEHKYRSDFWWLGSLNVIGNKCKKLQFIHTVNGDGSKTAKIIKGNVNHTNIAWMSMLAWLTLPFYDFYIYICCFITRFE